MKNTDCTAKPYLSALVHLCSSTVELNEYFLPSDSAVVRIIQQEPGWWIHIVKQLHHSSVFLQDYIGKKWKRVQCWTLNSVICLVIYYFVCVIFIFSSSVNSSFTANWISNMLHCDVLDLFSVIYSRQDFCFVYRGHVDLWNVCNITLQQLSLVWSHFEATEYLTLRQNMQLMWCQMCGSELRNPEMRYLSV